MPAPRIVPAVVREHAELAAFQWAQRDTLSQEDPPDAAVIAGIDKRLEANLDGLRIAGAAAWPFIIDQYEEYPEKGELFVVAVHAIETRDSKRIEQAVAFARIAGEGPRGLCGALEWLPPAATRDLVRAWIRSSDPVRCEAAIAALVRHQVDPNDLLAKLLQHVDPSVRAAACRLSATLLRRDAVPSLREIVDDPVPSVGRAAALALARLGRRDGEAVLRSGVGAMCAGWQDQLRALVATMPTSELRVWLSSLGARPETKGIEVRAAGMLGDSSQASWLIRQMKSPDVAEAAGAAFAELFPDAWADDDLWTQDADRLGPGFANVDPPHHGFPDAARIADWLARA